jgi:L-lactate dehydrogenase complex protein LldE
MTISLFVPCLTEVFFPETAMNMIRVLERLGVGVRLVRDQTCCGQPAFNSGYTVEAALLARRFLDLFENEECIVAPSGSCVTMVRAFYPRLGTLDENDRSRAQRLATRIFEFTEYLVDRLGVTDVGAVFPARVGMHDSCHALRELGVSRQPRALLAHVRDLDLVDVPSSTECCGFGGTFAVKNPGLSVAMGEQKLRALEAAGADVITAVDSSCLMHLDGIVKRRGLPMRAVHIADILAATSS